MTPQVADVAQSPSNINGHENNSTNSASVSGNLTTIPHDRISLLSHSSVANLPVVVDDAFAQAFLEAHNRFRKLHGVPNLQLSEPLCVQAQQWAQRIARKRHMSYCELAGIGECITFFPLNITADEIVAYWYEEHRKYEYETPGWQAGTNYFTQIVWYSTTELGVGRALVRPIIDPINRRGARTSVNSAASSSAASPMTGARRFSDTTPADAADNVPNEGAGLPDVMRSAKSRQFNSARSSAYYEHEEQVVVAFYRPAGNNNRAGQFALNVFKPLAGADS